MPRYLNMWILPFIQIYRERDIDPLYRYTEREGHRPLYRSTERKAWPWAWPWAGEGRGPGGGVALEGVWPWRGCGWPVQGGSVEGCFPAAGTGDASSSCSSLGWWTPCCRRSQTSPEVVQPGLGGGNHTHNFIILSQIKSNYPKLFLLTTLYSFSKVAQNTMFFIKYFLQIFWLKQDITANVTVSNPDRVLAKMPLQIFIKIQLI